ncbi:asparagine synthase (glutamine-hydrolyzing) [Actinoplanes sp. NPDC049548]|uniref:asparagine synthase (glutamine-hydrolyzing) n=1 Tax=Actinoplanes sp. NPDC049548 TaxID=3155152 RepID=UPI0034188ED6
MATATAAVRSLYHRGPDETEVVHGAGHVLAFQRLALVDPTGSHQPLSYPPSGPDAGRYVVVYNGQLYNYRQLRRSLIEQYGAQFDTDGDTEVVAAAHYYWGAAAAQQLRGMFSYVVWDRQLGRMSGARDRFGIKPFYYLATGDSLVVASEKKALLPFAGPSPTLDRAALSQYLTMQYVPEPATMHTEIRRLSAGGTLDFTPGSEPVLGRYWQTRFTPARRGELDEVAGRIRDALRDSVRAHMVADVPLGAFLSGGVDSTGVVALAAEVDRTLPVFTVGFDLPGYSELHLARHSAEHLGLPLTEVLVSPQDAIAALPRIVWHLDDPLADPSLVPLYFLAREAARQVTVVLSGEGADELFAGYRIYREPLSLAPLTALPPKLRRGLAAVSAALPDGVRGKSLLERGAVDLAERYYGNARIFSDAGRSALLGEHASQIRHTAVTGPLYAQAADVDEVTAMQHIDMHTGLPGDILTKADRMAMANALDLRVPFLDPEVFAVAATVPTEFKVNRQGDTKIALRHALRDLLPPGAADRTKLGLPTPVRVWLHGDFGDWVDDVLATSGAHTLLNLEYARELLRAHRRGEADNSRKVWTVLIFCLWYAIFVDRSLDPGPAEPSGAARRHVPRGTGSTLIPAIPAPRVAVEAGTPVTAVHRLSAVTA